MLAVGFVVATGALLWSLGAGSDEPSAVDQVSRTAPDVMGLQPTLTPALPAAPEVVEAPAPVVVATPTPVPAPVANDPVMDVLQAMSYGIVQELNKPVAAAPKATPPVETVRAVPTAITTRTHAVQPGDSLPGIAFRYYGTTVAYLQILQANPDVLSDPAQLRAGMVLRIPELH
ncbi:Phage Tail Protein X [Tropicibacter naphthalenivorans]|uniref:LysM domain/BON superfamily protein n=2 Tax=Tropicibacter naphthalenivorans TaxID=441103 RepID=A0A0N7LZZ4_9RHOB|nr:LysM domain/BON superfamily protein [Tropicibacter naphthalenivorans]SMD03850.1 Phage Tail Protein X [Tropicibacter naphthalenivorans]